VKQPARTPFPCRHALAALVAQECLVDDHRKPNATDCPVTAR
jgi:hypothetical protein